MARLDSSTEVAAGFSSEFQAAALAELDSMLKAPIFSQSTRCKRFLSYIVEQTLASKASQLKERTIGITVFERANDYDTGDDSIVRVTANEVRKRIAQYYGESSKPHSLQIELPRGSYVPEFRVRPASRIIEQPAPTISSDASRKSEPQTGISAAELQPAKQPSIDSAIRMDSGPQITSAPQSEPRGSKRTVYLGALILALCAAGLGIWSKSAAARPPDVWASFLNASSPILICIDTHDLHLKSTAAPEAQTFVDLVLYKQIISLDDAAVLASMTSMLGKKGIPFRVAGAEQTSLGDFRRQPVILIGAMDNKWTLRLTQALRYRIEVENPPGSGAAKLPIGSIVDSKDPAKTVWKTDLSIPFAAWKSDYAIVARFDDPTSGVPVLIEAGLGNDGSLAANEFVMSKDFGSTLASRSDCRGKSNFEAVLETELLDTRPGPPRVLRLICW